jgi:type I restriction enzyme S subunit
MDTKALRQKILDLAIHGKLVPQDPSDEPASVLLERIREQKKQMVKEGKLKAKDIKNDTIIFVGEDNLHYEKFQDGSMKCIEDEIPFDVPEGWEWCRLLPLTIKIGAGSTPTGGAAVYSTSGIKFIRSQNVYDDGLILTDVAYISEEINQKKSGSIVKPKDILLNITGGSIGRCALVPDDFDIANVNQHVIIIRLVNPELRKYLHDVITSPYIQEQILSRQVGSGRGGLSAETLSTFLIPLPPMNEQVSIIKKLQDCISYTLTIADAQRSVSDLVSATKSKILDLAIRGKLVPPDPNDEPASVLLERICAEKEELIKQGKIKRDKKESIIFRGDDNSYYGIHLPDNWNWASLREITLSISDGSHNPPPNNGSGIPLLSAANINDNSILMNEISRWITNEEWKIENQRTNIEVGDVLLTIVGSIGRSAVVQNNNHFALQRSVAVIKPCLINPLYLMHIVQSPQIQKWLTDNSKGTAQKGIYLNALSLMIIPIPPLAEQARIVEHIHIAYKQLDLISNALL